MLAGNSSIQQQKVLNGTPFFCAYGKDYAYTAKGLIPFRAVTYNFFNQPTEITDVSATFDNHQLAIDYGSNQQRISAIKHKNGNLETKHYYCNKYFDYEIGAEEELSFRVA